MLLHGDRNPEPIHQERPKTTSTNRDWRTHRHHDLSAFERVRSRNHLSNDYLIELMAIEVGFVVSKRNLMIDSDGEIGRVGESPAISLSLIRGASHC